MATKSAVIVRCQTLGVMLLDSGDALRIDSPHGKRFAFNGFHYRDIYLATYSRREAYDELLETMSDGLEVCDDSDCDCCIHENMTFADIQKLYRGERLA